MDEYYNIQSQEIYNSISSITCSTLYLICGDKGVGKSIFIQNILRKQNKKIIEVRNQYDDIDVFASLKSALYNSKYTSSISDLTYASQIINDFIVMCQETPETILYFDDISSYVAERSLKAIYEIIKVLIYLHSELKIIIIVECSKNILPDSFRNIYYDLRSLANHNNIYELENPQSKYLIKYFISLFSEPVDISEPMIMRICKSAFNNLLQIRRFVEYLKDINIIYFNAGKWFSEDIESQVIYNFFEKYIQPRYDKLNSQSKDVLQKASITGYTINTNLLRRPFQIMEPEKKLDNIMHLSHLIEHVNKVYNFETDEVLYYVQNTIEDNIKIKLHRSIAEYLYADISKLWNGKIDLYLYRRKLYNIAQHFLSCYDYEKSLYLYVNCIAISKQIRDFDSLKKCCELALSICEIIETDKYLLQYIHYNLACAEENLANFFQGAEKYKYILIEMKENQGLYDIYNIKYHYGYCLRRAGETQKALNILESLKKELSTKSEPYYKKKLVDVLVVLLGINDQLGKRDLREKYFNWCLNLSQELTDRTPYYKLLTKSSMYYTSIIAHKYIKEAFDFFNIGNNRLDAAIASYNLGMNEIYCFQLEEAKKHLTYSYEIFSTYGGNSISYPMCALGILNGIEQRYYDAILYFSNVITFSTNDFAKITALLNISQCYLKLNENEMAENHINMADNILNQNKSDKLVLMRNMYFTKAMLSYHSKDYNTAFDYINNALDIEKNELNYRTYNAYLARWIVELSLKLKKSVPDDITELANISLTEYKKLCFEQQVIWGNFMFW